MNSVGGLVGVGGGSGGVLPACAPSEMCPQLDSMYFVICD